MKNYSHVCFGKLLEQCFNQNFMDYLTKFKINEEKRLLMDENFIVKEVNM